MLAAFHGSECQQAWRAGLLESDGFELVVAGYAQAGAVGLVAVAVSFDDLDRVHLEVRVVVIIIGVFEFPDVL